MTLHTWLLFVGVTILLLATPGPTALIILRSASTRRASLFAKIIIGAALGDLAAMTLCNVGLGALLATSANAFTVFRACAGAYMVVVGILAFRRRPAAQDRLTHENVPRRPFLNVFVVTAFNPKGIVFFAAFLPQFVDFSHDVVWQLAILQATFAILSLFAAAIWALLGMHLQSAIRDSWMGRRLQHAFGLVLIATGMAEAVARV